MFRQARDEAVQAGAERRMLIRKLNTIVEDERKNIAIEIHPVGGWTSPVPMMASVLTAPARRAKD